MRFTDKQYSTAIAHLQDARTQLEPNGHGCHCCGGSGHQAFECGHNPLVAMAMCRDIAARADDLHAELHAIAGRGGDLAKQVAQSLHDFLHTLSGTCMYMGEQVGPAKVVLP